MKRTTLILAVVLSFILYSCGGSSDKGNSSEKTEKSVTKTEAIQKTKEKAEESTSGNPEFVKPEKFPDKTLADLKDVLSDKSYLDNETIDKTFRIFSALKGYDDNGVDNISDEKMKVVIDSIARVYDFADFDNVINNSVRPALFSVTILSMIEKSKDQPGGETMLKAILSQNPVSYDDLKFAYDNWDRIVLLQDKVSE